jgi:outer membrane protein insertion porin family
MFSDDVVSFASKRRYNLSGAPEANKKQGFMGRVRRSGGLLLGLAVWVAAALGVLAASPVPAAAQGVVSAIVVEGNRRIETETVLTYLRIRVGDPYSAAQVNDSLKALFATGHYADVTIEREGSKLIVHVKENPIVSRVAFEGNRKFDDETLAKEVQIKPRTVFTRARVQSDVQRLITLYRRAGRFSAQIEPKIIERDQDRVDLVFEISEGATTEISRISFVGNEAFSDSELRDVIVTAEANWWDQIIGSGDTYDPDRLNFDRELLRRHYLNNGYADFRVVSAVAELDRDQENFFITFTVEEGDEYRFGEIRIDSTLSTLSVAQIEGQLMTFEGEVYNAELVEKTVENITLEASELGFAFAEVRPRPHRDALTRTISITYLIDDGPRIYVERIDIIGNVRTLDHVIRREFRLAEGDAFNRNLLQKARRRLLALGYFERVDLSTEEGSVADRVIVKVVVEEKATGEIAFTIGYSTVDSVIGEISLTERNLLGRGQYVRIGGSLSGNRQRVDLRFTEPRFMNSRVAFGFDLFATETDSTDDSSFKSSQQGGQIRFGFPLHEELYLNTRYSFTRDELFDVPPTASLAVMEAAGTSNISLVGYTLTHDTLDNPLKPKSGVKVVLNQDFAGVGGDVQYLRSTVDGVYVRELFPDIVGVVRGEAGHILGWGGMPVRISDSFFKGSNLVRGFERSGLGPRDATTGDALGGRTFAAGSVEVTFPLGLPEELGVRGAVFVDAGTLFGSDVTSVTVLDSSDLRASGGASILWDSPIGPLRFDIAEAFLAEAFDKKEFFRFSGGVAF